MERLFSAFTPAKLYAFHLKLRPVQEGTLMPFNGELVQGAWLKSLAMAAPDVVSWLHEGHRRRLFTCSSLEFPFPAVQMREAEDHNVHLPLDPEKTYKIRITLLLGELFPLFYHALADFNLIHTFEARKSPFMLIGKQSFFLEEVVIGENDSTGWTGLTSFRELVEQAKARRCGRGTSLTLEFASLTTFSRGRKELGKHYALLPLPSYIFPALAIRWKELAPPDLADLVQKTRIEQYVQDEGIIITNYDLRAHQVNFTTHLQPGFIGKCTYTLRGDNELATDESPLTIQQQILLLTDLTFYCGIGYKTAMGMGQVRRL